MVKTDAQKIEEVLSRGVEEVIDRQHLAKKLAEGRVLRVKLGIDPTSPNIHLGRAIPLLKLRDFQNLGHRVVLIIGDFTGMIGDTSDKESERPMLDAKTIKENMKTYAKQAGKILDMRKCEVRYNSAWLKKLGFMEIGRMMDLFGLHEMESRENIANRLKAEKRVSVRELLYPIMQGYDSVAVKADVELGGTDQRFNLLAGREIQQYFKQAPQDVMTNPLLEGTDGRKMSSSWGNTVNLLDSADDMYGKIMSIPDELIGKYFVLATRVPMAEIEEVKKLPNPRDQKARLAFEIAKMYHGEQAAKEAENYFNKTYRDRKPDFVDYTIGEINISCVELVSRIANVSTSEAKRLIEAGAVDINGNVEKDWRKMLDVDEKGLEIKVGKKIFMRVRLK